MKIKKYQNPDSSLPKQITQVALQPLARKIGRTPSGYSLNLINTGKELLRGEESKYKSSFPSQDAYYYGADYYFPKAEHTARLNPNLNQYDVNFGRNQYEIPRQDSIKFVSYLDKPVIAQQGTPTNGEFRVMNGTADVEHYYDAGHHTLIPKKGQDGNYYVYLNDVYDFDPDKVDQYTEKYPERHITSDVKKDTTPKWIKKIALSLMTLMGEPYETHQTVPVKFVDDTYTTVTSSNVRDIFKNVLNLHNVELIKPIDAFSEDEIEHMFVDGSGDDLINHWENIGIIKHNIGGNINYLNLFK